ncbi:hypothetical protein HAHE_15160 [Haloferula helveola]|uniref:Uncharacterized protein n=2 Tax=Haloferula helveola TaxID=490095 RepID=A0ABM7RB65_9BACT|nr:hypothetical protein HAHE_15160 [Haloferula helveola]
MQVLLLATAPAALGDWRLDLLREEGIGTGNESLEKALAGSRIETPALEKHYRQLGSESFPDRVRAQQAFLSAGPDALDWLRKQPADESPEVRFRVQEIENQLRFPAIGSRDRMIRHAAASLLEAPESPATGGIFYEWFGQSQEDLGKPYRSFQFEVPEGMTGEVARGELRFSGERDGDDDQRLILRSAEWPGMERFPDQFSISAKIGGTEGGAAAWHVGITIGKVRALYHPGYAGGGFRFEQIGTTRELTRNQGMGFTPSTDELQRMLVKVRRLGDGDAELSVTIDQPDCQAFESTVRAPAEMIGPIDEVSLDRSGRTGGDARFDDFTIEFDAR